MYLGPENAIENERNLVAGGGRAAYTYTYSSTWYYMYMHDHAGTSQALVHTRPGERFRGICMYYDGAGPIRMDDPEKPGFGVSFGLFSPLLLH